MLTQAEETLQRFLRADNDDRSRNFGSIVWRSPKRAQSASQSARPDQWEGYHRRACGSVVSKCALRDKKRRSGFPERPNSR